MKPLAKLAIAGALIIQPLAGQAQDFDNELQARQGQFRLMAVHVGVLGAMAKGEMEYDPALAELAAENIETITELHQDRLWPEGSDNASIEGTRALPSIWSDNADFIAKWDAAGEAAENLEEVAGDGLDPMRAALGPLGNSCSECHDAHRQSDD